jgi:hypothetical protein
VNAVFERDYVAFSSSWRFLLLRGGFAAGMGLLFLVRILMAYAARDWADVGTSLLTMTVVLGAVLLSLAAPGAFATVLVHARASNALPVLFATPLSPLGISVGAFTARAGQLFLLVLATCPPLALALLFGGIRGSQILEAMAAATSAVLILGAPAFLVSAWARRTASAVVTAYLVGAGVLALLGLVGQWALTELDDVTIAAAISPYHAVERALDTTGRGEGGAVSGVIFLLLGSIFASAFAMVIAAWRLDREAHGGEVVPAVLTRRSCQPLKHQNPVLDYELRRGSLLGSRSPARGLLGLLLASELAYVLGVWGAGVEAVSIRAHFTVLGFQCLLLALAVCAAGATALAHEKETNTLELLRAAPLPPAHVVIGKLAGVLRALLPCLLVPLGHLVYASVIGVFSPLAIPAVAISGTIVLAAWATFALFQSLDQREPQRAVARTMTLLAIVGVLLAANIGWPLASAFRELDDWVGGLAAFGATPIASILLPAALLRTGGSSLENTITPAPHGADLVVGSIALLVWLLVHTAFGHALYRRLARLYRTRIEG